MEKNIGMQKHAGKVGNLYFLDSFKTPTKINLDMVDGMTLVIQKKKMISEENTWDGPVKFDPLPFFFSSLSKVRCEGSCHLEDRNLPNFPFAEMRFVLIFQFTYLHEHWIPLPFHFPLYMCVHKCCSGDYQLHTPTYAVLLWSICM